MAKKQKDRSSFASTLVTEHFGCSSIADLVSARRSFPATARADLQSALEWTFSQRFDAKLVGLHRNYGFNSLSLSDFLNEDHDPVLIGPLQYAEVDTGDPSAVRCLQRGLWLSQSDDLKFIVILDYYERHGSMELSIEVSVLPGTAGSNFSSAFLVDLEKLVYKSSSYRGKVLSLEQTSRYSGKAGVIKVHKLHSVEAIEFPLPDSEGRRKLIRLYSHNLPVSETLVDDLVRRTERATPAFIKELMRRSAQYYLQDTGSNDGLKTSHIDMALDDMLFSGGSLNAKLLGAAEIEGAAV